MQQIASITRQGQLTIPKKTRETLGINGATKVRLSVKGRRIIVEPVADFWSLAGSMRTDITLSDKQLRAARASFERDRARKM